MQRFEDQFTELYNHLNRGQKQAVDAINGPVMVIAGPGTGKTQILATRILNILRKTDTNPKNILCLTYTEAGATAMRQRLSKFMGTESYKVNIYTFHGLCNKFISDRQDLYGKRELRVMDDLERMQLIQSLLDDLPHSNPLKDYQSYNTSKHKQLSEVWGIMRDEKLQAEDIEQMIEKCQDEEYFKAHFPDALYKRNYKGKAKGDINPNDWKKLMGGWEMLIEAARLLKPYQEKKKALGVYEFQDMIEWVYEKLSSDEEYKMSIQEEFNYVLVDEFQDTSYLQSEIMHLLIDFHGDNPDCFVVGDDDQSIYAFQGARLSNMLDFKSRYSSNLTTVVLTENYRSSQPILDASGLLIKHNQHRLVNSDTSLSKELDAASQNQNYPQIRPIIKRYFNEFHEVVGTVEQITQLLEKNVAPKDIAIIYTKHRFAEPYIEYLRTKKIAYQWDKSIDILGLPIIDVLIDWLEYFQKESTIPNSGEHLLFPLLTSKLYDFRPYALNQMSADIYEIRNARKHSGDYTNYSWRDHIQNHIIDGPGLSYLNRDETEQIKQLFQFIDDTIKGIRFNTLGAYVSKILSEFGFISYSTQKNQTWLLEVLHSFVNYINEQCERNPFMKLNELLETISTLKAGDIPILLERRTGDQNGIKLMSAHGSKGLEFKHVFIIRGIEKEWGQQSAQSYPFKVRDLFEGMNRNIDEDISYSLEERRRLFFVAMTRAEETLNISYFTRKLTDKKDSLEPTMFLNELAPDNLFEDLKPTVLSEESLIWAQQQMLISQGAPLIEGHIDDKINKRLENFVFSPSSIKNILECGLSFYYNNIVRVPSSPNEYLSYGNAIHHSMRHLVDTWVRDNKWMETDVLIDYFSGQMNRFKGHFTEKQFDSRLEQGKQLWQSMLPKKKEEYIQYKDVKTEYFVQSELGGVPIKGMVDKLIIEGKSVKIIDYKTGNLSKIKSKSTLSSRFKEGQVPSDYWLQVGIYCLMIEESAEYPWHKASGGVEPMVENENGDFETIEITFSEDEKRIIKNCITTAFEKLTSRSFLEGCGKKDCSWCRFAKNNDWVKYLPSEQIEL